ncbi:hypothetical protein [Nocardioides sp. YIM 152315]|uniref:hypothetical protein n=1 Tax=Nocardioides sp. YIM 152315 TaxID=3031760 RepID=UPI0023DBE520|nr:hypothetical protein [Nocardioides sp. YIM 152315]MDF1602472.1 hypothetical protein [Nocardioides sp. YIM 152315]
MKQAFLEAWSDVAWAGGFVRQHVILLLALGALPATARTLYAGDPGRAILVSGPAETLIGLVRMLSLGLVVALGWRSERPPPGTAPTWWGAIRALGRYLRRDWDRCLLGLLIATLLLAAVSVGLDQLARGVGRLVDAPRAGPMTSFALRNLVTITLTYPLLYALVRPAVVRT